MAVNPTELKAIHADYEAVRGQACNFFVCPITLRDEQCELIDGHIVNKGLQRAPRATIVQRKDVDNYFGSTIEPDLINRLNNENASKEEWFNKGKHLFVIGDDGKAIQLLHSKSVRGNAFPRVDLLNDGGAVWASAHLKGAPDSLGPGNEIFVGCRYRARNGAVLGCWMKIAYLTMFKLFGYQYVSTAAAEHLRRPLCEFVMGGQKNSDADEAFGGFSNACGLIGGPSAPECKETLTDRAIWVRVAGDSVFGITLLFRINGTLYTVTVPWGAAPGEHYQRLMANPAYVHEIYPGVAACGHVTIAANPITVPVMPAK